MAIMCDVQKYRSLLDGEVEFLKNKNSEWDRIVKETDEIPEEAHGRILQCTGHSKLLLSKRLREFGKFLDDICEEKCENVVKTSDLQGLWELIDIQMEKLRGMFGELDALKNNKWEEEKKTAPEKVPRQPLGALNKNGTKVASRVAPSVRNKDLSAQAKERLAAAKERARQMRTQITPEQVENLC